MRKKSLMSRIGSTILAGLTALSVVTTSIGNVMTVEAASGAKLATTEQIVGRAASLLGTKYAFGAKGGTAYTSGSIYSPWASTRSYGIDCSGLVWWTLTSLGYSTSGYSYNNPVPVDTPNWLYPGSSTAKYVTRGGGTSRITYEKEGISTDTRPYYQINASKNIRPGSVVVAENPYGTDHAWIYIGEFDNETQVENYVINALKVSGAANYSNYMSESFIRSKITATNGNCRHWRIESNGSEGVVINNGEDGKTSGAVRITTFPMTPDEATFSLKKVKKGTSELIGNSPIKNAVNKNAIYNVYNNASCTGTPVGTITIGANGTGSITLPYATKYWVKEKISPTGYAISDEIYAVAANSTTTVSESPTYGSIIINKQAEDGLSVANRTFEIDYIYNGELVTDTHKTDASGKCTFSNLPVYDIGGTNTAIEFTVSEILTTTEQQTIIQPAAQKVKLNALAQQDFTTTLTFVNKKYGDAVLNKVFLDKDGERIATASEVASLRSKCSFGIVNSDGVHIAVTGSNGVYKYQSTASTLGGTSMYLDANNKITVTDLPKGNYTWVEKSAPTGFAFAGATSFTISNASDVSRTMYNRENNTEEDVLYFYKDVRVDGTNIYDAALNSTTATVVSLALYGNTRFRAYMLIDDQKVYLTKIGPVDTDEYSETYGQASAIFGDSYMAGKNGHDPFPYTIDVADDTMFTTDKSKATPLYVYAHPMAILGQSGYSRDKIGTIEIHMEASAAVISGAAGENATARYNAFKNRQVFIEEVQTADPEIGVENGETTVRLIDETLATLVNDTKPVEISVVKRDSDDRTTPVVGAKYTATAVNDIKDHLGNVLYNAGEPVETAVTELDDRGRAVAKFTKLKLFGVSGADIYFNDYTITETEAPENYNLSGNVFETKAYTRSVYNSGLWAPTDSAEPLTLTFNDYEDWQTAAISAYKYENYTDEDGYNRLLSGAEFTLSAAENVTKADGTIIYNKGEVIETIVSGTNGEAAFTTKLPVGFRYTITETKAPEYFTLTSDNSQTILLAWDSESTNGDSFPNYTADFFNDYQSGSVSVFKIDKDDNTKYLSGAEFTLYAGEDINVSGYKYAKDEAIDVISTEVTDENTTGTVKFTKDVPVGFEYYIVETKAPQGYKLDDETKHTFELVYDASLEHIETRISVEDESIDVDFAKIDVNGDEIEGAEVQVLKKETVNKAESEADEPILVDEWIEYDSWTSTDETHRITTMPAGDYKFVETYAPDGYVVATDIEFTVTNKGKIIIDNVEQTSVSDDDTPLIEMVDDCTKVWFYKLDEEGNNLPGAKIKIVDSLGNVVDEFTSDVEPYKLEAKLTAGLEYKLIEDEAPGGYYYSGDVSFTVSMNGEIDIVNMEDTPIVVELSKKALTGEDELPGALIQVLDEDGNVIDEWTSTEKPHVIDYTKLIAGKSYTMHEVVPAPGYNLANDIDFDISKTDEGKIVVLMRDTETHIEIAKSSDDGEHKGNADIIGAKLQIIDKNGNVVEEWITDGSVHTIVAKLISGETYTLHEAEVPENYERADDIEFTVSTDGSVDEIEMFDKEETGSVKVYKHTEGDLNIEGIKFILSGTTNTGRDVEYTATTDKNGVAVFNNIPVGTYVVNEDTDSVMIAYLIADEQNVTVTADTESEISFYNNEKTGTIHVQKRTEGGYNVEGIKFVLSGTSDSGRYIELEAITDKNGDAYFENVPIGTYTITEDGSTVPAAYLVAEPTEVTVLYAETVDTTVFNNEKTGSIHVEKHTEGGYNVSGIKFVLSGTSDSGREISIEAITDANGDAVFENVPIGTYTITEDGSTVPAAYLVAEPTEVTVLYAETVDTTVFNNEKTGSIKVQKRTEGMTDISGIKFILKGTSDSGRYIELTAITDENGVATFTNVPIGTYEIYEDGSTVPAGYLVADAQTVTVYDAQTKDVTFVNEKKPETPTPEQPSTPAGPGTPNTGMGMTAQQRNDNHAFIYLICAFMGCTAIVAANKKKRYTR